MTVYPKTRHMPTKTFFLFSADDHGGRQGGGFLANEGRTR